MKVLINSICTLCLILLSVACGSKAEQTPDKKETPSQQQPATSDATGQCSGTTTMSLVEGAQKIDGNNTKVFKSNNEPISLCGLLKETGKKVLVIQIVSPTCVNCVEKMKLLDAAITSRTSTHQLVMVIPNHTDAGKDFSQQEIDSFVQPIAPHAMILGDANGVVWKQFSEKPESPLFPTFVIMNAKMEGFVLNKLDSVESDDVINSKLIPIADQLMK